MQRRTFLHAALDTAVLGAWLAPAVTPALVRAQSGPSGQSGIDPGTPTIVFGGSVPLSGAAAETGANVYQGYQAAVKFVNEELGGVTVGGQRYQLVLRLFDDASDPARAINLIQRQVDEGIDFFLGSFGSNIVLPTCAITEAAGRLMVQTGGGGDQIFTQGRKRVFGVYPRASRQFVSSVALFKSLQPAVRSVSILYTNDPFSSAQASGARREIEAAGMTVRNAIALPSQVNDVTNVLTTIRANPPDVLLCTTHDQTSILIARQMVASDTNVPMLYQALGPATAAYKAALGRFADGVVAPSYWSELQTGTCPYFGSPQGFADYFRANFERELVYHMAGGALCILTYIDAAKRAGSLAPDAVRAAIAATDLPCFYGRVRFTEDGDGDAALMGPILLQRQNGGLTVIAPPEAASAPVIYPAPDWQTRG